MSNHSTTLRYWLERHIAGDPAATEELIRFSQDRLRIIVRSRLRSFGKLRRFEDSEDVLIGVQSRFAAALRNHQFPALDDFIRFGARLVQNQLVDFHRHYFGPRGPGRNEVELAPKNHSNHPGQAEPRDPGVGPDALARGADIDTVIERLPRNYQELFHALYYLGPSQKDVAEALDISLSTLKRHWQAAREEFLTRYGYDNPL